MPCSPTVCNKGARAVQPDGVQQGSACRAARRCATRSPPYSSRAGMRGKMAACRTGSYAACGGAVVDRGRLGADPRLIGRKGDAVARMEDLLSAGICPSKYFELRASMRHFFRGGAPRRLMPRTWPWASCLTADPGSRAKGRPARGVGHAGARAQNGRRASRPGGGRAADHRPDALAGAAPAREPAPALAAAAAGMRSQGPAGDGAAAGGGVSNDGGREGLVGAKIEYG